MRVLQTTNKGLVFAILLSVTTCRRNRLFHIADEATWKA